MDALAIDTDLTGCDGGGGGGGGTKACRGTPRFEYTKFIFNMYISYKEIVAQTKSKIEGGVLGEP